MPQNSLDKRKNQELEIKLHIININRIKDELSKIDCKLVRKRVLEKNFRFDTPDRRLSRAFQVLRLRFDTVARLTFKGPMQEEEGVRVRKEIEFTVSDFDAAYEFLQSLGYQVYMIYEKYRTVYKKGGLDVSVDELPYGNFI